MLPVTPVLLLMLVQGMMSLFQRWRRLWECSFLWVLWFCLAWRWVDNFTPPHCHQWNHTIFVDTEVHITVRTLCVSWQSSATDNLSFFLFVVHTDAFGKYVDQWPRWRKRNSCSNLMSDMMTASKNVSGILFFFCEMLLLYFGLFAHNSCSHKIVVGC